MISALKTIAALARASWLVAVSFRLNMVLSIAGLLFSIVPLFYIATALQSKMGPVIASEGGQFFSFVLIGGIAMAFMTFSLNALPDVIGSSIGGGTFETIIAAPTPLPVVLAGLTAYDLSWQVVRAAFMLIFGTFFGATFAWTHLPAAALVLALIMLAHLPLGMMAAAMRLIFRTSGPMVPLILILSTLLGGVYYPTSVIPTSWIQNVSALVPLSYGLRALRGVVISGRPLSAVSNDLAALFVFIGVLGIVGLASLTWALNYARRRGTLSQY
ncbi:MAG: ABC transporter permease [Gemmatimonadota bacterium]|nr:ABC transporter permease [Gemmatimonadota bacterium]